MIGKCQLSAARLPLTSGTRAVGLSLVVAAKPLGICPPTAKSKVNVLPTGPTSSVDQQVSVRVGKAPVERVHDRPRGQGPRVRHHVGLATNCAGSSSCSASWFSPMSSR